MKLFGKVVKTRPGWDEPITGYPYRGYIYNEYGDLVTNEVGGSTEEACKDAVSTAAQQIYQQQFAQIQRLFEIPNEKAVKKTLRTTFYSLVNHGTVEIETNIWSDDTVTYRHRVRMNMATTDWSEWFDNDNWML